MWKVLLCFAGHRFLLLVTALCVIYFGGTTPPPGAPRVSAVGQFFAKVNELPEAQALAKVATLPVAQAVSEAKDPFVWVNYFFVRFLGLPPSVALLFFSNVVFLLFLWELYTLMTRMVMPEVASAGTILAVLWPASYELSLGSAYGLSCFLATATMRHAIDNRWGFAGPALGLLALTEPLALGFLPLLVFLFWYFMRHFEWSQVARRGALFLAPIGFVIFWRYDMSLAFLGPTISGSALLNLFSVATGQPAAWTFSHSFAGQTISVVIFIVGAILSFLGHTTVMQKLVPVTLVVVVLAFTPYGALGSRLLLAAAALQGIASHSAGPVIGALQAAMLVAGIVEVGRIFAV